MQKYNVRVDEVTCHMLAACEPDQVASVNSSCAIIYERDSDFGNVDVVEPIEPNKQVEHKPSQKVDQVELLHLTSRQRKEICEVLDRYPECFSDSPGLIRGVDRARDSCHSKLQAEEAQGLQGS
jgi:hypothetical protein